VIRIIDVRTTVAYDKAAKFIRTQVDPLQNVYQLAAKKLGHSLAHSSTLNIQIGAVVRDHANQLRIRLARLNLMLQHSGTSSAGVVES